KASKRETHLETSSPLRAVVDHHVDRPDVQARQRVQLTGTNRSFELDRAHLQCASPIGIRSEPSQDGKPDLENTVDDRPACLDVTSRLGDAAAAISIRGCPNASFAGLVVLAGSPYPIPSRTRPLNFPAPMVLSLKTWKSRSLPGLPRTLNLFTMNPFQPPRLTPRRLSLFHHTQGRATCPPPVADDIPHRRAIDARACRALSAPRVARSILPRRERKQGATHRRRGSPEGKSVTAEAAASAAPAAKAERAARLRLVAGWLWSGALLVLLGFLVLYPVAMLLLGALTNTNPVVDGFGVFDLSPANFLTVLGNPNVHNALANSLIPCAGGTDLAVAIRLAFSWIVVRTSTP